MRGGRLRRAAGARSDLILAAAAGAWLILIAFFAATGLTVASVVLAVAVAGLAVFWPRPGLALALVLLLLAVSPQRWDFLPAAGLALPVQKALVVAPAVLLLRRGIRWDIALPAIVCGMLVVAAVFTDASAFEAVSASVTLGGGWVLAATRLDASESRLVLKVLVALPVLSVLVGGLLDVAGLRPLFNEEYFSGVARLQGATIAAHLGFLGAVSAVSAALLMRVPGVRRRWLLLGGVGAPGIVIASGSRTATALTVVLALPVLLHLFRTATRRQRVAAGLVAVTLTAAAAPVAFSIFYERSTASAEGEAAEAFNTSGRFENWAFYIEEIEDYPWFGRGLGTVVDLTEGQDLEGSFTTPHNEFIRLAVELGYIGAAAVAVAIAFAWYRAMGPDPTPGFRLLLTLALLVYSAVDNTLTTPQLAYAVGAMLAAWRGVGPLFDRLPDVAARQSRETTDGRAGGVGAAAPALSSIPVRTTA